MKRRAPRPICPKCCSADVSEHSKTCKCNRCGNVASTSYFKSEKTVNGPVQRASTDSPRHPRNLKDYE